MTELTLNDFARDQRVEMRLETSGWIRGDRTGTVWVVGAQYVHVKMDRSGTIVFCEPCAIARILPTITLTVADAPKESEHVGS